jgi:uncharacterized protein YggL (DUF469 family)
LKETIENDSLHRRLDLFAENGKDFGFLLGWAEEVRKLVGGRVSLDQAIEKVKEKIRIAGELLPYAKPLFEYLPEDNPEHDIDLTAENGRQIGFLMGYVEDMLKKNKTLEETKLRLLRMNMLWPFCQWYGHKAMAYGDWRMLVPPIQQSRINPGDAGWVESWFKKKGPTIFHKILAWPVAEWIEAAHEGGTIDLIGKTFSRAYSYDEILQAWEAIKKYYGMAPDLHQPDTREKHQEVLYEWLETGNSLGYVGKKLTLKEIWRWGDAFNWKRWEGLGDEEIEERFGEIKWSLDKLIDKYGYTMEVFNYSAVEALYELLTSPELNEEKGISLNITRWDIEKALIGELLRLSEGEAPATDQEKVLYVFKAMQNVAKSFGVETTLLKNIVPHTHVAYDKYLHIVKFDSLYINPWNDPFVGYQTRTWGFQEHLLNYLYGVPYFDGTAFLYIDVMRNH